MEILLSMKGETLEKAYAPRFSIMKMPTATTNHYFIAEFREYEIGALKALHGLLPTLSSQLGADDGFIVEQTQVGFKLKKRWDQKKEYRDAWEQWLKFSYALYREIAKAIGVKVPEGFTNKFPV